MVKLNGPLDIKIAVTSRGRAKVAASFFPSFYLQVPRSAVSTATLVMGESDTEMGGVGAPTAVNKRKYHFNFANPAALARIAVRGLGRYKEKIPLRAKRIGFSRAELTPRHYPELNRAIVTVDFSGWLFFCRQDLPNPVAYAMAKGIGLVHRQIPVDHFHGGKMTMEEFCQGGEGGALTIPLHPGAKRYYREMGCL